jgi:general secretion pathway protein D
MKTSNRSRIYVAFVMTFCLLFAPLTAYAKKGEKNFNRGIKYEQEQKWDLAAQEFALALAANPADAEYRLHYQRAMFNASQMFMQQGRVLEEKQDYVGAYNAFRQAYAYDPVNELSLSEMERMMRLQQDKVEGKTNGNKAGPGVKIVPTSLKANGQQDKQRTYGNPGTEQKRVITIPSIDLKAAIKQLAGELNLNVIFDSQSQQFRQTKNVEIFMKDVTTAQALDYLFIQENLFFQKISRRTIIVADQSQRARYQQLVIRTFYLANAKPEEVRTMLNTLIPAQAGRMQSLIVPDKETNSVTIRDTAENVRLLGELIRNIDKDRPEVVMDVNIYEISKNALLQLGNQIGIDRQGGANGLLNVGGLINGGIALSLPQSIISAFERKNDARLLVSTQVHAFNNEESSARIGQRVPVQTAQVYPFTNTSPTTGGNVTGGAFGGSGFPVINFEPIGLTLKFTPLVFPNKDVQVKMSIESKDVFNADSLTPTFIERSITGTARIQNNRTMMLASVNQDRDSRSRRGIPLLGLIPILGRLFSTPTQDRTKTDIVIAVTPRVLRAPDITPRDESEYPSGTLQTPTWNSIADMIREEDAEEQWAQANRQNTEVAVVSNTDANQTTEETPKYVPATKEQLNGDAKTTAATTNQTETVNANNNAPAVTPQPINANKAVRSMALNPTSEEIEANGNGTNAKAETRVAKALSSYVNGDAKAANNSVSMMLTLEPQTNSKSNKRRIALMIDANNPLGMASVMLHFDPKMIAIRNIANGDLFAGDKAPVINQLPTPDGIILTVMPPAGSFIKGNGALVYLEVEMLQKGESALSFDTNNARFIAADGRATFVQLLQDAVVK